MSIFTYFATYGDAALLALRLAFGAIILVHGWPKIKDLKKNAENFAAMGFKPGLLFGTVAALLEVFGGLAILVGVMVQPVAALFVLEFVVILLWRIRRKHPFVGGWELDMLLLAAALLLLAFGAGIYAANGSLLFGY